MTLQIRIKSTYSSTKGKESKAKERKRYVLYVYIHFVPTDDQPSLSLCDRGVYKGGKGDLVAFDLALAD